MKLIDFLQLAYSEEEKKFQKSFINYALENLEYVGYGNPLLHDNCREGITHNGVVPRINPLKGDEILESGIYSLTSFGHDGREYLKRHRSLEEAYAYREDWEIEDNPYVHACFILEVY